MTHNPKGTVVDKIFFPADVVLMKEECTCRGEKEKHWNLLISKDDGEFLIETFRKEQDADWVMSKFRSRPLRR